MQQRATHHQADKGAMDESKELMTQSVMDLKHILDTEYYRSPTSPSGASPSVSPWSNVKQVPLITASSSSLRLRPSRSSSSSEALSCILEHSDFDTAAATHDVLNDKHKHKDKIEHKQQEESHSKTTQTVTDMGSMKPSKLKTTTTTKREARDMDKDKDKDKDKQKQKQKHDMLYAYDLYTFPIEITYREFKFVYVTGVDHCKYCKQQGRQSQSQKHKHKDKDTDKCKNCETRDKYLTLYHNTLSQRNNDMRSTLYERYSWFPDFDERMEWDSVASLIGFVIDDSNEKNKDKSESKGEGESVAAQIILFDITSEKGKQLVQEMAIVVLPMYQRRHIGTDLVRLTWTLFAKQNEQELWVYVLNSRNSGQFWRSFKRWYPSVNFKLETP